MNNILLKSDNNNIQLLIPQEFIQEKKEIRINKIILFPTWGIIPINIHVFTVNKSGITIIKQNSFDINYYDENRSKSKIRKDKNNIGFDWEIIDGYLMISDLKINRSTEFKKIEIYVKNILYISIPNHEDLALKTFKISLIPCHLLKMYITSNTPSTIESYDKNIKYTNLVSIKKPENIIVEFNNDDFIENNIILTNNNSMLYITDENDNLIDINKIYIYYSLY
jgi:hypothetical protein